MQQFQYTRLAYQAQAVESVAQVFDDVRFIPPGNAQANPTYAPHEAQATLRANIERVRADGHISAGRVQVPGTRTPGLSLDVLMETVLLTSGSTSVETGLFTRTVKVNEGQTSVTYVA